MQIPQIRIQSSMLLFNSVSETERTSWAGRTKQPLKSFDEIERYTEEFTQAWKQYERPIIEAMISLYGIEFKKSIIDVYVSPWSNSISNPLIINPGRSADIQIETLAHELLHVLFTDNTSFSMHDNNKGIRLVDEWRELFGEEHAWKTTVHIPVHAGLKAIFLDTLNAPERLERDIQRHQHNPLYKAAWAYVEGHDYRDINEHLAGLYKKLGERN
jgi:hypothetical protein